MRMRDIDNLLEIAGRPIDRECGWPREMWRASRPEKKKKCSAKTRLIVPLENPPNPYVNVSENERESSSRRNRAASTWA